MAPCSPPTPAPGAVPEPRPQTIPQVSLIFRFQMHTGKIAKDVLFSFSNMFYFSFPTCFFLFPPLCLKDELSVTFSQSFLLTNLGKVNGSVHVPPCPPRISESRRLRPVRRGAPRSVWGPAVVKFVTPTPCAGAPRFPRAAPSSRSPLSLPPFPRVCRPCVPTGRGGSERRRCVWSPVTVASHSSVGARSLGLGVGAGVGGASRCARGQRTSGGWRGLCCGAPPRPPEALAVGGRAGPTSRVPGKQARGPRSSLPRRLLQPRRGEPGRPGRLASTLCRPL